MIGNRRKIQIKVSSLYYIVTISNEREGKDLSVVSVYGRFDSDRSVRTRDAGSNSYVSMSVVCI